MIYLDSAATTCVSQSVTNRISEVLTECFANPSSLYDFGLVSRKVLEASREEIAEAFGCEPCEVYFTGCGTESNNIAILGAARARKSWGNGIIVTGYEHPSVQNTVAALEREGFAVETVMPDENGNVSIDEIASRVTKQTALVAAMHVNNETGAVIDVAELAARIKSISGRTAFHSDNVQGFLKQPFRLTRDIDTMSVSAHKIHGPKGIGALYVRRGLNLEKVMFGGGQERGLRSGTENIAYAAGFACASKMLRTSVQKNFEKISALNDFLRVELAQIADLCINSPKDASPYILNFSLMGYKSENILHFLEQRGIYVSSGSACARGERSHTLSAMGKEIQADSAIRISMCAETTQAEVREAVAAIAAAQSGLLKINRSR
ncbi:MAG: cysteine desulfurase family protein [Oscillospiraceae bacterium]